MAIFTVTSNANWEDAAFSTRAGNDTYNIEFGATFTIDSDTRYSANSSASTGALGGVSLMLGGGTLSIDATGVRLIPYNSGSGNVPAVGTSITEGGVSAYFMGVWSALNVAPTAVGAAMPASGYIKVKRVTGGSFSAGALSGIGATATGADIAGWIEVVGVETQVVQTVRSSTIRMRGAWFDVPGTTSGSNATTYQLPASLANTYYAGVWVETAVGSGTYEFYPSMGSAVGSGSVGTDAVRGKVCWISSQGLVQFGSDGTNTVGFLPSAGLRIRVPNIVLLNATAAAISANATPNATLTSRYKFNTASGGDIDIDKANSAWYLYTNQPDTVSLTNACALDQINIQKWIKPFTLTNVGVGFTGTQNQIALNIQFSFYGGTVTDCVFPRYSGVASGYSLYVQDVKGALTFTRTRVFLYTRTSASSGLYFIRVNNLTLTDCVLQGSVQVINCFGVLFKNTIWFDVLGGSTTASNPYWSFWIQTCFDVVFDGLSWGGLTNVNPGSGVFYVNTYCERILIKNIGSPGSRLTLGPSATFAATYFFALSSTGICRDIKLQRIYVSDTKTNLLSYDNSHVNVSFESVWSDDSDAVTFVPILMKAKGMRATPSLTAQLGVPDTIWWDFFTSDTAGRIGFLCNESTSLTAGQVTFTAGNPSFAGNGGIFMPSVGDQVEWTMPYYALGHTAFQNAAAVMGTATIGNFTLEFKVDTNNGSGFSGSWLPLTGANLAAVVFTPALGVKLKIRITTAIANTQYVTSLYVLTSTTLADSGGNPYPLDTTFATARMTRFRNRVYDTVAAGYVTWTTGSPDTTGYNYPGPGLFGTNTSQYAVEAYGPV